MISAPPTPDLLRDYQYRARCECVEHLEENPILVLPTGAGKTFTAASLVKALGRPTLWLAHRSELILAAEEELRGLGLNTGVIASGMDAFPLPDGRPPVWVASIQTLVNRELPPDIGLIIDDECHHSVAEKRSGLLTALGAAPRVGLTATPFRLDGRGLGDLYGRIIVGARPADLVARGTLVEPVVYAGDSPSLRGVHKRGGEYVASESAAAMRPITGSIVDTWLEKASGLRTVLYAVNVEHSLTAVEAFVRAGVAAEHLDGKTAPDERRAIMGRLLAGETQVVSNCMVWTEGTNLPQLECLILARPTLSLCLHLQICGRIMRRHPQKRAAIILDHAGNHHAHGRVTRHIEYSLESSSKADAGPPLGMKRCRQCFLLVDKGERICPECGWDFLSAGARGRRPTEVAGPGALSEFDDGSFEYRREVWLMLTAIGRDNGFKPGYAARKFFERFSEWPLVKDGDLLNPETASQEERAAVYRDFLTLARSRGYSDGWASHRYREAFGVWPTGFVAREKNRDTLQVVNARLQEKMKATGYRGRDYSEGGAV